MRSLVMLIRGIESYTEQDPSPALERVRGPLLSDWLGEGAPNTFRFFFFFFTWTLFLRHILFSSLSL